MKGNQLSECIYVFTMYVSFRFIVARVFSLVNKNHNNNKTKEEDMEGKKITSPTNHI